LEGGLGGVHVPLISDCRHKISKDYGVLIEEEGTSQRALFIIDPKGIVRAITVNDLDVGRSVDETLRVLDALIFKDEFGEGCPVDWQKGDKGIDITAKSRVEGPVELKKSWSEWARPKLQRAWSGTSQRSIGSNLVHTLNSNRLRSDSNDRMGGSPGHRSTLSSGQQSPMVSPTSGVDMEALMQQRMENLHASMQNQAMQNQAQGQSQSIGGG
jgi:peroxiredoxin (alkyl hydroperoxide reductase subunit C)